MAVRPILIINPRDDEQFVEAAERAVRDGADSPLVLEQALRSAHPRVVVRERGLSHERPTWYVYRQGSWRPSAQ